MGGSNPWGRSRQWQRSHLLGGSQLSGTKNDARRGLQCSFLGTRFVGYAFVDDTDLVESGNANLSFQQVALKMQAAITAWEGGIKAMGGAIILDKSFWYLVDFKWKQATWRYASITETPAELQVQDCFGELKTL
jgi:hypothetical protein